MTSSIAAQRPPLRRPRQGRRVAGVCLGLSLHLGIPVRTLRWVFALGVLLGGITVFFYLWLWFTVPTGEPSEAEVPAAAGRLAHALVEPESAHRRRLPVTDIALGVVLLAAAGLLVANRLGLRLNLTWLIPALIVLGGVALAWSQLDARSRERLTLGAGGFTPAFVVRICGGMFLVLLGIVLVAAQELPWDELLIAIVAAVVVLAGAAVLLAPWLLTVIRELRLESAARAREAERADIAAHLHDSVLQTLALIRAKAHDPDAVMRLSRAQERELRTWLYEDRKPSQESIGVSLRDVAAEIEDAYGVPIDVVLVGDAAPTLEDSAMLMAAREAILNAVRHGAPPVSVYCEVTAAEIQMFIRDRGEGFDPTTIAADRLGVRESIVARMERHGGSAEVRSKDSGTEVRLRMPRSGGSQAQETTAQEAR